MAGFAGNGAPLYDLLYRDYQETAESVLDSLVEGVALGKGYQEVAKEMRDAMGMDYDRSLRIARTEINRSYRLANAEQYRQSGVVEKVLRLCYKPTACFACLMMDGEECPNGVCDDHPNGKCTTIVQTTGGIVPEWQKGSEWLEEQSPEDQRMIMGAGRYDLWKNEGIDLRSMVFIKPNPVWGGSPSVRTLEEINQSTTGTGYRGIFDFLKGKTQNIENILAKDTVGQEFPEWKKNEKMTLKQAVQGTNLNCQDETYPSWMYRENCPKSAAVWELRRRGFLVEALPLSSDEDFYAQDNNWTLIYQNGSGNVIRNLPGNGKNEIEQIMHKWGDGSRAVIAISREEEAGHIFTAENINGKILYMDPQWGIFGKETEKYFSEAANGLTQILRVDNLRFTDRIYECATEAKR